MAQPTLISFSYDGREDYDVPKVMLRALIYATGKRGHLIENMFLNLHHQGRKHGFAVWGFAEGKLDRGGGLFVPDTGVVAYHHFNPIDEFDFRFTPGEYQIEVFGAVVGRKASLKLFSGTVRMDHVKALEPSTVYYFNWDPADRRYNGEFQF